MKKLIKKAYGYKRFRAYNNLLTGPYTREGYYDTNNEVLTKKNAIGFKARPVRGPLMRCNNGYHASPATKDGLTYLRGSSAWYRWYRVVLYNVLPDHSNCKLVGRSMKIIRACSIKEIMKKAKSK